MRLALPWVSRKRADRLIADKERECCALIDQMNIQRDLAEQAQSSLRTQVAAEQQRVQDLRDRHRETLERIKVLNGMITGLLEAQIEDLRQMLNDARTDERRYIDYLAEHGFGSPVHRVEPPEGEDTAPGPQVMATARQIGRMLPSRVMQQQSVKAMRRHTESQRLIRKTQIHDELEQVVRGDAAAAEVPDALADAPVRTAN
ncbi:MAG TPA: hypothetical protein VKY85_01250 [Candidatus Angelobacter sp.]|nr:hypothetical protein [Candidatus Angelobacter sp.]